MNIIRNNKAWDTLTLTQAQLTWCRRRCALDGGVVDGRRSRGSRRCWVYRREAATDWSSGLSVALYSACPAAAAAAAAAAAPLHHATHFFCNSSAMPPPLTTLPCPLYLPPLALSLPPSPLSLPLCSTSLPPSHPSTPSLSLSLSIRTPFCRSRDSTLLSVALSVPCLGRFVSHFLSKWIKTSYA